MATTKDGREIDVVRDTDGGRYRAGVGGEEIAYAQFQLTGDCIDFTHTVVDPSVGGQGVGSALIARALDDARASGYSVVATCPFVAAFIERHADRYADLVRHRTDGAAEGSTTS